MNYRLWLIQNHTRKELHYHISSIATSSWTLTNWQNNISAQIKSTWVWSVDDITWEVFPGRYLNYATGATIAKVYSDVIKQGISCSFSGWTVV